MNCLKCLLLLFVLFIWGCEKSEPLKEEDSLITHHVFDPPIYFDVFGVGDECDVYRDTLRLDLNNDAHDDLELKFGKNCVTCDTFQDFLVGYFWLDALSSSRSTTALALNGDGGLPNVDTTLVIDSNFLQNTGVVHWMRAQRAFVMSLPCWGDFTYVHRGERYVVFYIEKNNQIYYGWLLINVEILEFTIKEYAISNVPNEPLGVGDY